MDDTTTIKELKEMALAFRDERDWAQFHTPKDLAVALSIEAAELLEDIDLVLREINNMDPDDPDTPGMIRSLIDQRDILFKINVKHTL